MAGQHPDETEPVVTTADVIDASPGGEASTLDTSSSSLPPFARYNVLVTRPDNDSARALLAALEGARVESSHLSYLALDRARRDGEDATVHARDAMADDEARDDVDAHVARAVGKGAATGAATGALGGALAGLALMLVPGVGTLAGGGLLAAAIGGAAAGGDLGLLWGGFRKLGVSPAWEHTFVSVDEGHAVVGVHTDDRDELDRARRVLDGEEQRWFDRDGNPVAAPPGGDAAAG